MSNSKRTNREELVIPYLQIFPNSRSREIKLEQNALHEALEVKCFVSGRSTLLIGNNTVEAKKGDIVVINPFEFHATVDAGQPEGKYHLLMIPLDYFSSGSKDDLDLRQLTLERFVRFKNHVKQNPVITSCVSRIVDEHVSKRRYSHVLIRALLLEMFTYLLRENQDEKSEIITDVVALHSYQTIEPALRYIRDNLNTSISVFFLSELCCLSKHYFCRLFKSVMKKTVMEYIRDYRMKVAKSLLESTDKSVAQISDECGFVDSNYFCRCFKEHYGLSPGRFRKEQNGLYDQ